jgi:hypothetical protein
MSNTIREPFGLSLPITSVNVGAGITGVSTAVEYGDGVNHKTVITVDSALGAIAGGANLAVGKKIYTFPAGVINVKATKMSMALTALDGNIDADTPDVGIGTTIGSGAVNVLGGTAGFENMLTGQTAADCAGTATDKTLATSLVIEAAGSHDVFFNVADGWAASGEAACPISGTITIEWSFL